ncbi:electron transport complex protein RnfC [Erwinia persicina]|uniref:electron transport complex subunit RsxC n=1 Tax=Erwinia persicina TaxID=55211 RepID=UPI00209EB21A|nr:electron transport complex subunit RsxC [Erwinia persicina]MCP1437064.1 electron transport complex protein RnfC [Erwinia persicina]
MRNLFKLFKKEKLWDFQGGIHPPEMKTQSSRTPLRQLPLPSHFIIPLKQHIGHEGEMLVKPGDKVLRGQPLTFGRGRMLPVHAPTSGTVDDIAPHMTAHPSALAEMCIFITPDGEDRWIEKNPLADYRQHERAAIVERIHQAGVAGLGGAGFPTATKLRGGLRGVKTLIINAAECEPYITADDRLMQDCADEVIEGSRILGWVLQAERVLIGIEDNKPEAIAALKKALGGATDMQIRVIPTKYPSGGAKQLTKILTGLEVPHGGRSTDIGVLMQNVGTAWAVKRAIIDGEPLTERVVTLTGEAVKRPGNVWGRIGTPISHLLQQADFTPGPGQMVVMGGPLMGFTLPTLDVPVVKITNCILAPSASEMGDSEEEKSCIRCSACADACPAALLPQQLYWYSRGGDHDKAREHNIDDCIECGACAYVCPSNIPLVQYYRQEKAEIRAIDLEAERTAQAKARFEARQARLEREKLARENRHQQAKRTVSQRDRGEVEAALERVKAKQTTTSEDALAAETAAAVAQREARKAQARAQQAEKQSETEPATRQAGDPRKAAVEAAIARAKAKKATTEGEAAAQAQPVQAAAASVDPRKAAVEAAVARAKAKKAAAAKASADDAVQVTESQPVQAAEQQSVQVNEQPEAASVDPRKAAVEAAIARAKAKKAAAAKASADDAVQTTESQPVQAAEQQSVQVSEQPEAAQVDPRKAAVEAAIARAKAKKAAAAKASAVDAVQTTESQPVQAAEQQSVQVSEQPEAAQVDPRKAAVEAAIARAKAKKAAAAKAAAADDIEQRVEEHQAATTAEQVAQATTIPSSEHDDPRKAAVAAAIARVKARKAQHSTQED